VSRRTLAAVLAAVVALALLVPVGRWERSHRAAEQIRGMRAVLAEVGPLDSPSLDAFRRLVGFDCLLYERGQNPFALEVCVDHEARVIETIDRRGDEPRIWSLRDDRTRSTLRVDRTEVDRLLARMIEEPK
jgi:hypothetical protein